MLGVGNGEWVGGVGWLCYLKVNDVYLIFKGNVYQFVNEVIYKVLKLLIVIVRIQK